MFQMLCRSPSSQVPVGSGVACGAVYSYGYNGNSDVLNQGSGFISAFGLQFYTPVS